MAKKKICKNCKHYTEFWDGGWCLYHDSATCEGNSCDWWEEDDI